ncbi:MAG: metallophosphoesterase [Methanolobus sp.]|nr:metallophosphoesterase [Methanolobus sp.]
MPALESLKELLAAALEIFRNEKAVVSVKSSRVMLIGDIHGNLKALDFVLGVKESSVYDTLVFLGDYVDRGNDSIAVLSKLLKLKIDRPGNIVLLRGNHETREMNIRYGFFQAIGFNDDLLDFANMVFEEMPVAAIVNNEVFCVHGGIPGPVDIYDISKEYSFEYLWNDPSTEAGMTLSVRGMRSQCFGGDVLSGFLQKNRLSLMVRGHTALKEGYEWWFEKRLLSLFSTPEYCGYHNNGAFATFENGNMNVHVFGPDNYSRQYSLLPTSGENCPW